MSKLTIIFETDALVKDNETLASFVSSSKKPFEIQLIDGELYVIVKEIKEENSKKLIGKFCPFLFPKRLWENIVMASEISLETKWADINKKQINALANQLTNAEFQVNGKSTFKEEFVTAGGINLKEINFKTMQSKVLPNVYFAGEVLNIDAITGGFNFQNAWTSGFIVAKNI